MPRRALICIMLPLYAQTQKMVIVQVDAPGCNFCVIHCHPFFAKSRRQTSRTRKAKKMPCT
jgi:hypothetical protein